MIRADVGELVAFLDSLAKLDPVAMGRLVGHRVGCNIALSDHPTVQTGPSERDACHTEVGMLGILNGYAGTIEEGRFKGWGPIAAVIEADGRCTGFQRVDQLKSAGLSVYAFDANDLL